MKRQYIFAGIALCLLFPVLAQGQEIGLLRLNPDRKALQGSASVWGGYEIGGYRPTYGAASQWTAGADATGALHGKTTSWTGSLSFGQTTGKGMSSSLLLEPGSLPMDVLEFSQGTKSRQDVRLEGGFLTELGYEWALGFKASLKAANSVKRENLSHTTSGLSLRLEPTATYVMDDDWGLASAYIFQLRSESIRPTDGAAPSDVFFDMGMRYGYMTGSGPLSVREITHGFSGCFQNPDFSIGLQMLWKNGSVDDLRRFPGNRFDAFVEGVVLADRMDHLYHFSLGHQADRLQATLPSGSFGDISSRSGWTLDLSYGLGWEKGFVRKVQLALSGKRWAESYLGYPFYDRTKRLLGIATLLADFSYGPLDLELYASGGRGFWQDHGLEGGSEGAPERLSEDWLRKMEYDRVLRGEVGGFVTYHVNAVKGLYVRADASWIRAFHITYLPGHHRVSASLKVGYNF